MPAPRKTRERTRSVSRTRTSTAAKGKPAAELRGARKPRSPRTSAVLSRLDADLHRTWPREPADLKKLRHHRLPPMGHLPCVFYANFNTFWVGENLQVMRQLALGGKSDLGELSRITAALLRRHAARLAKWKLTETVALLEELATYFERRGPKNRREFADVAESTMIAIDRVNAWIDAMIPWSQLDRKLQPVRPPV